MTYNAQWEAKTLKDIALINPDADETLPEGTLVKQVNLDRLKGYSKFVHGFETVACAGKSSKFRNDDVLVPQLSSALNSGKTALVDFLDKGEIGTGSNWFIVLRAIDNISEPHFLYYLATTPWFRELANKTMEGSTQSRYININTLKEYKFPMPAYDEQCRIAATIRIIDDKIKKNAEVCEAIEKILKRIFYDWFHAYMFRSEPLPQGWRRGSLCEIGDIVAGATPSKRKPAYYTKCGIPWITPKDLSKQGMKFIYKGADDITEEGRSSCNVKKLPRGTVLFSSRAPIGYVAIAAAGLTTNQGFRSIVPFPGIGSTFVYYLLLSKTDEITKMASGSTFKEISGQALKKLSITIPEQSVLTAFDAHTEKLMRYQAHMEKESRLLNRMHHHLLPLLMSGALRIRPGG